MSTRKFITALVTAFTGLSVANATNISDPSQLPVTGTIFIGFEDAIAGPSYSFPGGRVSLPIGHVISVNNYPASATFPNYVSGLAVGYPTASTPLEISFLSPISQVGFGVFDPNFPGNIVSAYNRSGQLLESAQIAPTYSAGGYGAVYIGFSRRVNEIYKITLSPATQGSTVDLLWIDNLSYYSNSNSGLTSNLFVPSINRPSVGKSLASIVNFNKFDTYISLKKQVADCIAGIGPDDCDANALDTKALRSLQEYKVDLVNVGFAITDSVFNVRLSSIADSAAFAGTWLGQTLDMTSFVQRIEGLVSNSLDFYHGLKIRQHVSRLANQQEISGVSVVNLLGNFQWDPSTAPKWGKTDLDLFVSSEKEGSFDNIANGTVLAAFDSLIAGSAAFGALTFVGLEAIDGQSVAHFSLNHLDAISLVPEVTTSSLLIVGLLTLLLFCRRQITDASQVTLASVQAGKLDRSANTEEFLKYSVATIEATNGKTGVKCEMR